MKNNIIFCLIILLFSCKNESKDSDNSLLLEEPIKKLELEFYFKTDKADEFKIIMSDIKIDELQNKSITISENVIPSTNEDRIIAKFDEGNFSDKVMISLGNKELKSVKINRIFVKYGLKEILLSSPEELNNYLFFNKFIDFDMPNKVVTTKEVDGNHNPVIFFKPILIKFLEVE